jgi:biopolymer transport protein ExbD
MSWNIRHEGSPRMIEGLTLPQVVEGLQDGLWEPTDEVMGPQERQWVAIENHPQLAELAADMEPPLPKVHDDETRLDMNPLIDVALVLLIFFILTTSYAALQKVLKMPDTTSNNPNAPLRLTKERIHELLITVKARKENGVPVFYIEDKKVEPKSILTELSQYVSQQHKTQMLIDAQDVDWGTVILLQDAAKAAGIEKAYFLRKRPAAP